MSTSHTTLSTAADERKARLAKLASLKRKRPDAETDTTTSQPEPSTSTPSEPISPLPTNPHLSSRNYDPSTRAPKLGFDTSTTLLSSVPTVESQSTTLLTSTLQSAAEEEASLREKGNVGIDLFKLQPRKPNWDLKRELAERMRRGGVEAKTQGAIARLVRERIEGRRREMLKEKELEGKGGEQGEVGEEVGIEGAELVEGVHLREREVEEEERREREEDEQEVEGVP
jgi:coiled-coil domain-containing protein 12